MFAKLSILTLAALPLVHSETVLGVYIFHRHGDRTPKTYTPVNLTALGADQVFSSGTFFRNRYISSTAQMPILGMSHDIALLSQMSVTSPIDTTLQNSASVFMQGLYPPAGTAASQELANGTSVEAPFGGYQYIPVNAVSNAASNANSENNEWLQANSGCGNALVSSNSYLSTKEYQTVYNETLGFYHGLLPVINGTFSNSTANFKNGYTIFDLVNVATIHNRTIPSGDLLTPPALLELKVLADVHEWNLAFNASEPIRAIAGSVLAAQILQTLNGTLTARGASSAPRLGIQFGAYATFMSFFGLAGLPAASQDFTGIVDYASAAVFELVTNATGVVPGNKATYPAPQDVSVRFLFVNGTAAEHPLQPFPLFGGAQTVLPWTDFVAGMQKFTIGDTPSWCRACGNYTGVCADATGSGSGSGGNGTAGTASGESGGSGSGGVSSPVAGVIGALVTLAVILGLEALVMGVAGLRLVRKNRLASLSGSNGSGAAAPKA